MLYAALKYPKKVLIISFLVFSAFLMACQEASGPRAGKEEAATVKDSPRSLGTPTKGSIGGECEGFDILRTPVKTSVEAMPCAQYCPTTREPVCTAEGYTYPNACFAEMAKAVIMSQGECQ